MSTEDRHAMISLQDDMLAPRMATIEPACVKERGIVNDTVKISKQLLGVKTKLHLSLSIRANFMWLVG